MTPAKNRYDCVNFIRTTMTDRNYKIQRPHSHGFAADEGSETASDKGMLDALEGKSDFKGYTLDELRYRLVVNRLKIKVTHDKLLLMTSPKMQKSANSISEYVSGFNAFFRYVDIAMVAYAITRRVVSALRFFVPKRKK